MDIKIATLYSGSSGNSVLVGADGDYILIDAGKSCRALTTALSELDVSAADVSAVFVTHEHIDHIAALEVVCKKYHIPVHMAEQSASAIVGRENLASSIVPHTPIFSHRVGKMTVRSFKTHHDSAMSVGYTVEFDGQDVKFGLLTDTGHVTPDMTEALCDCTHLVLEANHDIPMLYAGFYPYHIKERIRSARGHLSNEQCGELAATLAEGHADSILLAHISENNNTPELALRAVGRSLSEAGFSPSVGTAHRSAVTRLI